MNLVTHSQFRLQDKDGSHIIRPIIAEDLVLHANFTATCVTEAELWPSEDSHCGNRDFGHFYSCDLDTDLMTLKTFTRELDLYSM